jgi:hypothetical protein
VVILKQIPTMLAPPRKIKYGSAMDVKEREESGYDTSGHNLGN